MGGPIWESRYLPTGSTSSSSWCCAIGPMDLPRGRSPPPVAADDCVLFLWCTWAKLEDALRIVQQWGFDYKTVAFTWVKQNPLGGAYGREWDSGPGPILNRAFSPRGADPGAC